TPWRKSPMSNRRLSKLRPAGVGSGAAQGTLPRTPPRTTVSLTYVSHNGRGGCVRCPGVDRSCEVGRAGIEPGTLGLKSDGSGCSLLRLPESGCKCGRSALQQAEAECG